MFIPYFFVCMSNLNTLSIKQKYTAPPILVTCGNCVYYLLPYILLTHLTCYNLQSASLFDLSCSASLFRQLSL